MNVAPSARLKAYRKIIIYINTAMYTQIVRCVLKTGKYLGCTRALSGVRTLKQSFRFLGYTFIVLVLPYHNCYSVHAPECSQYWDGVDQDNLDWGLFK